MLLACTIWGLAPLYYAQLQHVPPLEVLCYRAIWSCILFAIILAAQRRLGLVGQALRVPKQAALIVAAALFISANWFGFIYAISVGKAIEASLGYYIYPLVAVVIGRLAFAEHLQRLQWWAIGLAGLAVLILTAGLGVVPILALWLAATFAVYGVIKRGLAVGPVVSVTAEVIVLLPFAIGLLWIFGAPGDASMRDHALLSISGPITAIPLILFTYSARRVRMSSLGLTQYLNPTLQFSCAVFIFSEPFTQWHAIAFPMIWLALAMYSFAQIRQDRALRKAASNSGTESTISM